MHKMTIEGMDFHRCLNFQCLLTVSTDSDLAYLKEQKCEYRLMVAKREGELGRDGLEFGFQKQTIIRIEFNKQQALLYSTGNYIHTL